MVTLFSSIFRDFLDAFMAMTLTAFDFIARLSLAAF